MIRQPAVRIRRLVTQPFGSNTYSLSCSGSSSCLVIDPGTGSEAWVAEQVGEIRGSVEFVLLTHEHFDHIAGVNAVKQLWRCSIICSKTCSQAATDPTRNFSRYLVRQDITCQPADVCCEALNWSLSWNSLDLQFIPTPGHSPGGICVAVAGALFTGDTLLPEGKRVTRVPGANKQDLERSLDLIYSAFPPNTVVFPGHGEPFHLGEHDHSCQGRPLKEVNR